jgi:sec-independent protein translocase protein TatA
MLGNIGSVELFVIMITILLVFGAKRIPEIARALGSGIREFKEAGRAISKEFQVEQDEMVAGRPGPGRSSTKEPANAPRPDVRAAEPLRTDETPEG